MTQNPNLAALSAAGVSVWLDDLSRQRLQSGNLQELIDTKSVVGVTTNPSIFQKALAESDDYQDQVAELAERGADVDATVRTVTTALGELGYLILIGVAFGQRLLEDGRVGGDTDDALSVDEFL